MNSPVKPEERQRMTTTTDGTSRTEDILAHLETGDDAFNARDFATTAKWDGDLLVGEYVLWDSALQAQQIGLAWAQPDQRLANLRIYTGNKQWQPIRGDKHDNSRKAAR